MTHLILANGSSFIGATSSPRGPDSVPAEADAGWRWPRYRQWLGSGRRSDGIVSTAVGTPVLRALASASYIEWRYYAVLAPAFHGMVGLALVNPEQRFAALAEGGLLVIVAGVLGRDGTHEVAAVGPGGPRGEPAQLCWMHRFALDACRFDADGPGALDAADGDCRLTLRAPGAAHAEVDLDAATGLGLRLSHCGVFGQELSPVLDRRLDGHLGRLLGSHWQVTCPSPVARCDGVLRLTADALGGLAESPAGGTGGYASPALRDLAIAGATRFQWRDASGYAEHSFGVRPLPLQGWDFLFVPSAETGQAVVLQTYRGSGRLRYLEVCWRQEGSERHHRFLGDNLRLDWSEAIFDPVLGVRRPLRRRVEARDAGLTLRLDSRVLHRIPLLRHQRLAVRHFFISEEIGVADWQLTDTTGRLLASGVAQPCGGELAHFRLRAPRTLA
jgi:hypothetical protein